jgi:hypothetical protein
MKSWMVMAIVLMAATASADILWIDAPTTYEDGTPMLPDEIVRYTIYQANGPNGPRTLLGTITCPCPDKNIQFTLDQVHKGKYLIVFTAGKGGESSVPSSIRWFPPGAAVNLRITK